jgi:hypothetical protein
MKKMSLEQMEVINGGQTVSGAMSDNFSQVDDSLSNAGNNFACAISIIGFGLAFAGLVTATGGAGLIIAAASFSIAPASAALSCAHLKR